MKLCACLSVTTCLLLAIPWAAASPQQQEKAPAQGDVKPPARLTDKDLQSLWDTLGGGDAAKAYRAIWSLVGDPERSVPFLNKHLAPVPPPEPGRLEKLVAALDSKRFAEREKAMAELEKMGALAKAALEKKVKDNPSLEMKRRLDRLLDKLAAFTLSGEELRTWRALEALELIGNTAARQALTRLATGAPGVWQTEEARAALDRLSKRVNAAP